MTRRPLALLLPGLAWLLLLVAAPLVLMLGTSLLTRGEWGSVALPLTLDHYARFADPLYLAILGRTVALALLTTVLCLALAWPLAWTIARSGRWRRVLLLLVVLPFWTSALVRTYALIFLLREGGLLNGALLALGLIDAPLTLLYTRGAVLAGLVYGALPYMVLPLYASLEAVDPVLLEAAEVLGARPWARFRQVLVPLAAPGAVSGAVLVFVPTLGAFLTPDLLGGAREMLLGTLVQNQFGAARNWPFGSAAAFAMMLALGAVLLLVRRRVGALAGGP